MTKRTVTCPICELSLGRFHDNASATPVRDHIYKSHPKEYKRIVKVVSEIDERFDWLKTYGIGNWDIHYYHDHVDFEKELENTPPMTDEQRKSLLKKIMEQD